MDYFGFSFVVLGIRRKSKYVSKSSGFRIRLVPAFSVARALHISR